MIDIGFNVFDGSYMGITFLLSLSSIFITTLALVSKSADSNIVWVQVPPPAP